MQQHPLRPVWVVVPDRLQAFAFRRRLAAAGGAIGVNVGTFGTLYKEILRCARKSMPLATEPVIHRLIRLAIKKVDEEGELAYFNPLQEMPGFSGGLADAFAELKRARVWPDTLLEASREHGPGLVELARIYAAYQDLIGTIGWADPEGVNWLATEALEEDPTLAAGWQLVIVDGFDSLNGSQRAALNLLGETLPEILITLPGVPEMSRVAHRRFDRSLQTLLKEMPAEIKTLSTKPYLPSTLLHLEESIFKSGSPKVNGTDCISMMEARSPKEEAREALRWIKARIVRDGLSPDDCSIVTPDPERYRPFLREAAVEFGVPIRFTHGEPLTLCTSHRCVARSSGASPEWIFSAIDSGYPANTPF